MHAGQEEEQEIHPWDGVQQRAQGNLRAQQLWSKGRTTGNVRQIYFISEFVWAFFVLAAEISFFALLCLLPTYIFFRKTSIFFYCFLKNSLLSV